MEANRKLSMRGLPHPLGPPLPGGEGEGPRKSSEPLSPRERGWGEGVCSTSSNRIFEAGAVLGAVAALVLLSGCGSSAADCPDRLRCPTSAAGTGGAGGGSSATGAGGAGGMVFDPCAPTDQSNIGLATCGIFVRNEGSDGNAGTPDLPVATLAKAIELAGAKGHVYACNQSFPENLVVTTGVTLFGGLDCTKNWAYAGPDGNPTVLTPPAGVPLSLLGGAEGARLKSFQIVALADGTMGGFSTGVIAAGATAVIEDSQIFAADALSGADGLDASPDMDAPAPDGAAGGAACSAGAVVGGLGPKNMCGDSTGGNGGDGGLAVGGAGAASWPAPGAAGGLGESGVGWTCGSGLGSGHLGLDGASGAPGGGGLSLGQIGMDGFHGADGGDGDPGQPGQGGGGGGGRAGPQCGAGKSGASGGSGAPGGCGGKGGGGGRAGGSSIGILSVTSKLTLKNVVITAGNGGRGGEGGDGQPGALGGKGGPGGTDTGTLAGCAGGNGGRGGSGGVGGGGRGGHSIGVAHDGSFVTPKDGSITVGSAGPGGPGSSNNAGAEGLAKDIRVF